MVKLKDFTQTVVQDANNLVGNFDSFLKKGDSIDFYNK